MLSTILKCLDVLNVISNKHSRWHFDLPFTVRTPQNSHSFIYLHSSQGAAINTDHCEENSTCSYHIKRGKWKMELNNIYHNAIPARAQQYQVLAQILHSTVWRWGLFCTLHIATLFNRGLGKCCVKCLNVCDFSSTTSTGTSVCFCQTVMCP